MLYKKYQLHLSSWAIPALYAAAAFAAGLTFSRFESRIFPGLVHPMSVPVAITPYSSIASSMLALTGIVSALTFVMVQFSATAYSPRLVMWVARDPVISHALGIFTATFLYALAALGGVARSGSETVPFVSAWVVIGLMLASTGMFISLVHGILQLGASHLDNVAELGAFLPKGRDQFAKHRQFERAVLRCSRRSVLLGGVERH